MNISNILDQEHPQGGGEGGGEKKVEGVGIGSSHNNRNRCHCRRVRPDLVQTLANNSVDSQPEKSDLRINRIGIRRACSLNAALKVNCPP